MDLILEQRIINLFDQLMGRKGSVTSTNLSITKEGKPECILELIQILQSEEVNMLMRLQIINKLYYLLAKSARNRYLCAPFNILQILSDMLPNVKEQEIFEKLLSLVEISGRFSMNVKQTKKYFSLLNEPTIIEDRKVLIIRSLQNIVTSKGPRIFFDFDGISSGVKLPEIEKWPGSSYSISLWFQVESFDDPSGIQHYEPRLFSFLNSSGIGVEAYFMKKTLYIRTNQNHKTPIHYNFEAGRWYHIVFTHSYSPMEWLSIVRSSVKFYVMGKVEYETTLKYPDFSEPPENCYLGTSMVVDNAFLHIPERRFFYGQMAMFCLFGDGLTAGQVPELYQLGYNYIPSFHKKDLFTRHGAPKTLLAISPKGSENGICINLANHQGSDKSIFQGNNGNNNKSKRVGKLLGSTLLISTYHSKDSVYCASGTQTLLPLLNYLGKLTNPPSSTYLNSLISLMGDLLGEHQSNQQAMEECNGFALLGSILQTLAKHIDTHTINAIDKLIRSINTDNKQNLKEVMKNAYASLILNFDIWFNTSFAIQRQLCGVLEMRVEGNPSFFRNEFGVQRFFDIIRNHYCFSEGDNDVKSPDSKPQATMSRLKEFTEDELRVIQGSILRSAIVMISDTIEANEVQSIVYFLHECTDSFQLIGMLRFLFELLSKPVKNLMYHLEYLGGIRNFVFLINKPSEAVREASIKVLGKYIQQSPAKQQAKILTDYGSTLVTDAYPLSEKVYCAMVEFLLDECEFSRKSTGSSRLIGDARRFENPQILPSIFRMVLASNNSQLKQQAIQEFLLCLTHNPNVLEPFVDQFGWQSWLLMFLAKSTELNSEDESRPLNIYAKPYVSVTGEMIIMLLSKLLHGIFSLKDGWKFIEETEAFALMYAQQQFINSEHLLRYIYIELLSNIEHDILKAEHSKPNPIWKNLVNFIELIDEFTFHSSVQRDPDGKWADYNLVLKVLDVYDVAIRPPNNSHLPTIEISSGKGKDIFAKILRLTLCTFQEAFGVFYGKNNDDDSNSSEPQANSEMEKLFYRNVQRVRALLLNAIQPTSSPINNDETNRRVMWALWYVLKAIWRSLKYHDTSHAIIIPLAKEILRNNIAIFPLYIGENIGLSESEQAFQETASVQEFIEFTNSVPYFELISGLEKFKNDYEESLTQSNKVTERREKLILNISKRIKQESSVESSNKKKLDSESVALNQKYRAEEVKRRNNSALIYTENRRNIDYQWKRVRRELTNDRSCWWSGTRSIYWKVDSTETSQRMRRRMKRNYRGSDHKEASAKWKPKPALGPPVELSEEEIERMRNDQLKNAIAEEEEEVMQSSRPPLDGNLNGSSSSVTLDDNEPISNNSSEDILKTLSNIHITVRRNSMDVIEEFDFQSNELEDSWCVLEDTEEHDSVRVAEKIVFFTTSQIIHQLTTSEGRFILTATTLYFFYNRNQPDGTTSQSTERLKKDKKFPLSSIVDVTKRRFQLRNHALEIFLSNHKNYMFNFPNANTRKKVMQVLARHCPGRVENINLSPQELLKKSGYTQQWQRREISNFEYLMKLNTLAGRTYNDLTQYPVFPWIIADYESDKLDLNDPSIYRDLSKPIGALNPTRLKKIMERYEAFEDPNIPKFHYGSHYSSLGTVLYYMIRLEPYTTQFLEHLQGGQFDVADRMFHSMQATWQNCMTSASDVKELIPEFFYLPEFLRNSNKYDLGVMQNNHRVDDVVLPPWASSPEEFIRINREALESEYVSANLHEWIDLIFGYKQTGKPAEKAYNLFYYLTYEGSVDIENIEDPVERSAIESQIANFGQTPSQLLFHPHPQRNQLDSATLSVFKRPSLLKPHFLYQYPFSPSHLSITSTEIYAIGGLNDISAHRWSNQPEKTSSNDLPIYFSESNSLTFPSIITEYISPPFAAFPDELGIFAVCSKWDSSFRLMDSSKVIQIVSFHKDRITCFAISSDGKLLVTGSRDTTVCIWECKGDKLKKINKKPKCVLRGHDDEVTTVAISLDLDICVSGSKDGTITIHTIITGKYVRSISHPQGFPITKLALTPQGHIVCYSNQDYVLHLFDMNGRLHRSKPVAELGICDMVSTRDGEYVIVGGRELAVMRLWNLEVTHTYSLEKPARVVAFKLSPDERQLFVAMETGRLFIFSQPVENGAVSYV